MNAQTEPEEQGTSARLLVSVVVPSRGGRRRLETLLQCFEAQTEPRFEVVVVIDGDVDDSAGLLRGRTTTVPLHVVTFPENRGRSAALNAGMAAARGRVLVRCDDDLEPKPDFVALHLEAHAGTDARPLGVVGLYRNVFPDTPYARAYGRPADVRFREDAYRAPADTTWRYWAGNVSVTRETADRVGAYDEGFRAYGWRTSTGGTACTCSASPSSSSPPSRRRTASRPSPPPRASSGPGSPAPPVARSSRSTAAPSSRRDRRTRCGRGRSG